MKKTKRFRTLGKGSAMIEMTLILPLVVMLIIGVVEFSRVLMVKQVITNAAREGARAGAIRLDDSGALSTALSVSQNYLTSSGVSLDPATVNSSFVTTGGSSAVEVTISYDYNSTLSHWIPGIPGVLTLQSAAIMRREA
ncbi:MAG: pilus assembly protein [Candidatus Omnitrophica bacterium]|nr:pilus assembly protein [Candidatus Omnitrophota bacterium]